MLPERDEVIIAIAIHELDFVSVLRAARLLGATRENVIRQAIAGYLVQLQKQGLDVGIQLPPTPAGSEPKTSRPGEGQAAKPQESNTESGDGK